MTKPSLPHIIIQERSHVWPLMGSTPTPSPVASRSFRHRVCCCTLIFQSLSRHDFYHPHYGGGGGPDAYRSKSNPVLTIGDRFLLILAGTWAKLLWELIGLTHISKLFTYMDNKCASKSSFPWIERVRRDTTNMTLRSDSLRWGCMLWTRPQSINWFFRMKEFTSVRVFKFAIICSNNKIIST